MRRIRNDVRPRIYRSKKVVCDALNLHMPIKKPKNPIHAERLWRKGLLSALLNLSPIFSRKDIRVKVMKNSVENARATAINAAAEAVGADNTRCDALSGRTDRSGYELSGYERMYDIRYSP